MAKKKQLGQFIKKHKLAVILVVALMVGGGLIAWRTIFPPAMKESEAMKERIQAMNLSTKQVSEQEKASHTVDANDKPKSITIPSIGVNDVRVQEIGLLSPSADGTQQMDAPKNIYDVGWYNCQINPVSANRCAKYVAPLSNNTSEAVVMDGHSCNTNNCVFNNIGKLKPGDLIQVVSGNNKQVDYQVELVERVKLADVDMAKVMRTYQQGTPGINLITCVGSWSARDSRGVVTMDSRVIVYATKRI